MRFIYGPQDFSTLERGEENCWLMTNGLGGYASTTGAWSVNRCDMGLLVSAVEAPNYRVTLVHRIAEELRQGENSISLSSQQFGRHCPPEEGYRHLTHFVWQGHPRWQYQWGGVSVTREVFMPKGENTTALVYQVENHGTAPVTLCLTPSFLMAEKGQGFDHLKKLHYIEGMVTDGTHTVYLQTSGAVSPFGTRGERLHYAYDLRDGRREESLAFQCMSISLTVPPEEQKTLELVFSDQPREQSALVYKKDFLTQYKCREQELPFRYPLTRQLAMAAEDYIVRRDSTNGMSIIAGYPFFGDWGRDTMIALPGCCLSTGKYEEAKSILRTFLAYEKDGLVPNLFPEGKSQPMYNTADGALLLINAVWLYLQRTGDRAFLAESFPVLERIMEGYQKGTAHGIHMESDGLIAAGEGLDQVTWMDVCVDGILPTPRHGKPVEINAYWYNALCIMAIFREKLGIDSAHYRKLAEQVKQSFCRQFWLEEGYLKDVLSGTKADRQIRCNQIWAVTMPFTMLTPEQEKAVVDTVTRHLYTPVGLRSLSPLDEEFHPTYGGSQYDRDLAYHQGTVWTFPLGAYYLAWWKVYGDSEDSAEKLRHMLEPLEAALREGCVGQLPEIYDGLHPTKSQGCFGQAWSVGELFRVCELLERWEAEQNAG